jgi:hypothetical protein
VTPGGSGSSRSAATTTGRTEWPTTADVTGWSPVLPGERGLHAYSGLVTAGTLYASYAPAGRWHLTVDGQAVPESSAFGWAAQYATVPPGDATLRIGISPLVPLGVLAELVLWLLVAAALLGRRRWLYWWWRPLRDRQRRRGPRHAAAAPPVVDGVLPTSGGVLPPSDGSVHSASSEAP